MVNHLESLSQIMLPAVEESMQRTVGMTNRPGQEELHRMLAYHMGWEGEPAARGKRIRPLLVLLTTEAAGGEWRNALPAASAVELLHNFSLIHDDIEDNSPLRRGRETIWKLWGVPQAINTGDALFTLAHLALLDLSPALPADCVVQAARLLHRTCLHLTEGQHRDIAYESNDDLTLEEYWEMVNGKTAALLAACTGLGALTALASSKIQQAYQEFGLALGQAFQSQDDLLGIWGDAAVTGKSAESDLVSGKKTLPVLYGLRNQGEFANAWIEGPVSPDQAARLADLLDREGAREYTGNQAKQRTRQAMQALERAEPSGEAGEALHDLARMLLSRSS